MRWAGRDGAWLGNWGVSRTIDCNLKFFFPGHSIQSLATATTSAPKLESKEQSEKVPPIAACSPHYFTSLSPLLPLSSCDKSWPWLKLSAVACDVRKGNAMWAKLLRLPFGSVSTMPQHANLHGLLTHTRTHGRVCVHAYVFLCVLYVHMLRALLIARTIHYLLLSLSWKFVQLFSAALKSSATQHTPTHTPAHTLHKHTNLYSTLSCW